MRARAFRLVAEVEGRVIANSEITKYTGFSSHVCGLGIGIKSGYRDVGIWIQMMKCLISQAKNLGLKLIELSVFATNERAIHVYRKVGFKEAGRKPNFIFKDGEYIDHVDMVLELRARVAEGDKVVTHKTFHGTHKGEFMGIPPTGKKVALEVIDIFRIAGGKFTEHWAVVDMMSVMQQLGVLPSPSQPK